MMGFWDAKKSNNAQYQKCKINLDLNEARDDGVLGCSGISYTICKQSSTILSTSFPYLMQYIKIYI